MRMASRKDLGSLDSGMEVRREARVARVVVAMMVVPQQWLSAMYGARWFAGWVRTGF